MGTRYNYKAKGTAFYTLLDTGPGSTSNSVVSGNITTSVISAERQLQHVHVRYIIGFFNAQSTAEVISG